MATKNRAPYMRQYRAESTKKIEQLKQHMKELDPDFYNSLFP